MSKRIRLAIFASLLSSLAVVAVLQGLGNAQDKKAPPETATKVVIDLVEHGPTRKKPTYFPYREVYAGGKARYFVAAGNYRLALEEAKKLLEVAEHLQKQKVDPKQLSDANATLTVAFPGGGEYRFHFTIDEDEEGHRTWKLMTEVDLKAMADAVQDVEALKTVKPSLTW